MYIHVATYVCVIINIVQLYIFKSHHDQLRTWNWNLLSKVAITPPLAIHLPSTVTECGPFSRDKSFRTRGLVPIIIIMKFQL